MVIAKRVVLREWKSESPPCFRKWQNEMVSCFYLDEIRYTLSNTLAKFNKIWRPFVEHIRRERPQVGNWLSWFELCYYPCVPCWFFGTCLFSLHWAFLHHTRLCTFGLCFWGWLHVWTLQSLYCMNWHVQMHFFSLFSECWRLICFVLSLSCHMFSLLKNKLNVIK